MKKYIFIAAIALASLFTSCQVNEINGEPVQAAVEPIVFTATIEGQGTKTAINYEGNVGKVSWVAGDLITVTCKETSEVGVYAATTSGASSEFTHSAGVEFTNDAYTYSATYGNIDSQSYSATGANCPMAAPEVVGRDFRFRESAAMLLLNVKADGVTVATVKAAGKTLDCGAGVLLNTSTGTDFYIAIPAGTYNELSFTFISLDGKKVTKTVPTAITVAANHVKPIYVSQALEFAAPPETTDTYYQKDGSVVVNPVVGDNTQFTATSSQSDAVWVTDFKFSFSSENGNAIDFDAGDCLEAKCLYKVDSYACSFGLSDISTAYNALACYTNGTNDWWRIQDANDYHNTIQEKGGINAPLIIRLSKANGIEIYNHSSSEFDQIVAADNEYLSPILQLGTTNALYFGLYVQYYATVTYEYLKVTRGIPPVAVTGVSLNYSSEILSPGGTLDLSASVTPSEATTKTVTWMTSDAGVATVDDEGHVTAIAEGNATITAITDDGYLTASCDVAVQIVHVSSVSVPAVASVPVGKSTQLSATISPDNAYNKSVLWTSDNEGVATVDSDGEVTGVSEGTCTITVTSVDDPSKSASCSFTVSPSNEVILLQNVVIDSNDKDGTFFTKELSIITKGAAINDNSICFENGDYLEVKISNQAIPASDRDLVFVGSKTAVTAPYMPTIKHPGGGLGSLQFYICPSGWWSLGTVSPFGNVAPIYIRYGCKSNGKRGCGSYSIDGTNWTTFAYSGNFEAEWAKMIAIERSPLIIQPARTKNDMMDSTYEYVKIVRAAAEEE